jgi:hypothetical protein
MGDCHERGGSFGEGKVGFRVKEVAGTMEVLIFCLVEAFVPQIASLIT